MYEKMIQEFKDELHNDLLSAIKFGSEGEHSNLLFVLEKLDFPVLEKIKKLMIAHKQPVVPLFFTLEELKEAADVFPLEFLDIAFPHEVLYGKDAVKEIKFDKVAIRCQLEFELRSKLVHLRENYIWIKNSEELKRLLISAVPSLMPMLYGLLFIKDIKAPADLALLFEHVNKSYKVDTGILTKAKELANMKASDADLRQYTFELMELLTKLIEIVNKL
jgi:hypothetical protein